MTRKACEFGFWNETLFMNNKYPIFTECFQYYLLLIPAAIFTLLFTLFISTKMYKSQKIIKVPFDIWYIIKLSFQVILIILLIAEIGLERSLSRDGIDPIYILSYTILCITLLLVILLTEIRRRTMNPSCPILFLFWLSGSLAYTVRFYSNVIRLVNNDGVNNTLVCVSGVILGFFVINFIGECCGRFSRSRWVTKKKVPCPEEYSSILSKITYSWLDKYVYKWFKEDMTDETTFDLRRDDEAKKNTNIVHKLFIEKIKHYQNTDKINDNQIAYSSSTNLLSEETRTKNKAKMKPGFILFRCLMETFGWKFALAILFKIIHDVFMFITPFLLKIVLEYIQNKNQSYWMGYMLAVAFLAVGIICSLADNMCFFISSGISVRIRAAIIGIVYRKTLKVNNEGRSKFTSGEIVNMMSVDAERIMGWIDYSWFIVSCPFQIIMAIIFLYGELSYSIFVGLGLMIAFFPLNALTMRFLQKYSEVELIWKDKRVKILTDILSGIKVLKMYAWEKSFLTRITNLRNTEMKYIFRGACALGVVSVTWEILPFFVLFVIIITYVFTGTTNIITPEKAFVSLALLNLLRFPMIVLPWGLSLTSNAFVSLKRIGEYLVEGELDQEKSNGGQIRNAVEIYDGSFSWKKEDKIILNKINLEIPRGKLVAIVGKVGTGKSSLISAMLGEMHKLSGSVQIQGKVAYVPQEAWIQNKTVKNNILFTESFEEVFYNQVIEACSLTSDLEQLPAGDETEIGERGINLSGGQKQRVSLARAVYQKRDIYLLDDPLSAVDAHVGQHLFEHVISNKGILNGKTRILVTHGLNWLPMVDEVFVLDSNGTISERGSFKELLKNGDLFMQFVKEYMDHNNRSDSVPPLIDFAEDGQNIDHAEKLLRQMSENNDDAIDQFTQLMLMSPPSPKLLRQESKRSDNYDNESRISDIKSPTSHLRRQSEALSRQMKFFDRSNSITAKDVEILRSDAKSRESIDEIRRDSQKQQLGQLIDEEQAMSGTVKWKTYLIYLQFRGVFLFLFAIFIYALNCGLQVFNNIWLQKLTEDSIILNANANLSLNPSNFEKDRLIIIIRERVQYYMIGYASISVVMAVVVSFYFVFYTIGSVRASKIIHKVLLKSVLRSPMEFFDTTPSGRILNRFSRDLEKMDHVVPTNISDGINCLFIVLASILVIIYVTPWFAIIILPLVIMYYFIQLFYMPSSRQSRRLDSIATSPVFNNFTETLQGVSVIRAFGEEKHFQKLNDGLVDRSNKFRFIQISSTRWLSFRIDTIGNLMIFGSVLFAIIDRGIITAGMAGLSISYSLQISDFLNWVLRQYTELETNFVAMERIKEYSELKTEAEWDLINNLSKDWPNKGNVNFHNYDLRYREGLPLVLKNINLQLIGGEKIGIVGRTGAGKSSLNLALFRLVEAAGGKITIDGVDISKLGLHDLRMNITILPQDPMIFAGTIRENLDPFNNHTEDELFQSLETAHLKQWISTLPEGIEYECGEGGANLSVGQKQLLCLARALLRKSKVLILDEATASVDVETDRLVMDTIRNYFQQSTVIIIAHRINTIIDTDKIVVMDQGQIVEMDSPRKLLEIPNGIFKSLYEQSLKHDL